ncbi:MAG: RluA family pseudouridine synthase [Clostridia bacterium]|nr:RluA family pseudouridine synthase [Clostridia bacterium]
MSRSIDYVVDKEYDGEKLKIFLRRKLNLSYRSLVILKHAPEGLKRNGEHIRTIDPVHTGDVITVTFPAEENAIDPTDSTALDIVYEDDDILIVNKPAGLAVHPTHNHQGDTLANQTAAYYADKNIVFRSVGRLDKCTSGLIALAKNRHAASFLPDRIQKEYLAVVGGVFHGTGTIDRNIYRPDQMKTLRAVSMDNSLGETAVTHWEALGTDGKRTLMRIMLETGRTHQIRVHFASLGAPLAGDEMYGSTDTAISRAALHCAKLTLIHPITGEQLTFTTPLPDDMQKIVLFMNN